MSRGRWRVAFAVALLGAWGCWQDIGGSPDAGGVDAGTDAGVASDSGLDGGGDAGLDAGWDGGIDGGFDAGLDAGLDAGVPGWSLIYVSTYNDQGICGFASFLGGVYALDNKGHVIALPDGGSTPSLWGDVQVSHCSLLAFGGQLFAAGTQTISFCTGQSGHCVKNTDWDAGPPLYAADSGWYVEGLCSGAGQAYAVARYPAGGLWNQLWTFDGGWSFSPLSSTSETSYASSCAVSDAGVLYLPGSTTVGVANNSTWINLITDAGAGIFGVGLSAWTSGEALWVAGTNSAGGGATPAIFVSPDAGPNANVVYDGLQPGDFAAIHGTGPNDIFAVTEDPPAAVAFNPRVFYFDGGEWDAVDSGIDPTTVNLEAVYATPNEVYVGGVTATGHSCVYRLIR